MLKEVRLIKPVINRNKLENSKRMLTREEQERAEFEARIAQVETPFIKLSGLSEENGEITRHWSTFQFEGQPFRLRYFMFGDPSKPYLVMALGYMTFSLAAYSIFKGLSAHFRVLIFDNFASGGNSRPATCQGTTTPEAAKACILEWFTGCMASIDHHLPAKFMMYSSSTGAYNMSLWIV